MPNELKKIKFISINVVDIYEQMIHILYVAFNNQQHETF